MLLALAAAAQAVPINGTINMLGGSVFANGAGVTTTSLVDARRVQTWINPRVLDGSGSYAGLAPGTAVAFTAPWIFSPSTPTPALWSVGGFTFNLSSSTIVVQEAGFLGIRGSGTVTSTTAGLDPTPGTWFFTTQGAASDDSSFSWSSSTVSAGRVPDGGATLALLGVSFLGLGGARRFLASKK